MASVDEVIVQLRAEVGEHNARIADAERRFSQSMGGMERSAQKSSDQIKRGLSGMAGSLAKLFDASRIVALADSYTRFANRLALAGLEGDRLAQIQQQLFEIAQRNGVAMESLGELFVGASQSAGELGATSAEVIQFVEGVAAGLRAEGATAAEASQAIAGMAQALEGATVEVGEFNEISGAAPILLKAVAQNIDQAGGSVSRLRDLVANHHITNEQFFRAFLASTEALKQQAVQTSLTIGNAFTVLNDALGMYIGQTDDSLSATERISQAIIGLANNLDTVAAVLGILSTALVSRFVVSLARGSTALFAMRAVVGGAATGMEALRFTATAAGRSLLAAFGGPVGAALAAIAIGIYYLTTRTDEASQASGEYARQQAILRDAQNKTTDAIERLATATGRAREEALANVRALRQETEQLLANARAALESARAHAARIAIENRQQIQVASQTVAGAGAGYDPVREAIRSGNTRTAQAATNVAAAEEAERGLAAEIQRLDRAISDAPPVLTVDAATTRRRGGRTGPTPEEIARRFLDDLDRLQAEQLQAQLIVTDDAEDRADIMRQLSSMEHAARLRDIEEQEDYTEARKAALREELTRLYGVEPDGSMRSDSPINQAINREMMEQLARETLDVQAAALDAETAALEQREQLATTQSERRAIQEQLLDAEIARLRLELDSLQAWQVHERRLAQARLDSAIRMREGNRELIRRGTAGPLESYLNRIPQTAEEINEAFEGIAANGLASLNDGLADAVAGFLNLGGTAGRILEGILADILRVVIQTQIMAPLLNSLGVGGDSTGSIVKEIGKAVIGAATATVTGGKASGGHVTAGNLYRINEGSSPGRVEGFVPAGQGKIIPLGQMDHLRAAGGGGGQVATVRLMLSGDIDARIDDRATNVSVQVFRAGAPHVVAQAKSSTLREITRTRIPGGGL